MTSARRTTAVTAALVLAAAAVVAGLPALGAPASLDGASALVTHRDGAPQPRTPGFARDVPAAAAQTADDGGNDTERITLARVETNGQWAAPRCDGNGQAGNRFQVVVAHISGTPTPLAARGDIVQDGLAAVSGVYERSSDGARAVRWVHDRACRPTIARVTVPASVLSSPSPLRGLARHLQSVSSAYRRTDRKFLVIVDGKDRYDSCGIGTTTGDSRKTAANANNVGPSFAAVWRSCMASSTTMAHELAHTLGAVQRTAPHKTDQGHCWDGEDIVCYDDGSPQPQRVLCRGAFDHLRLDCRDDDYFAVQPAPGSYLARSYNTADNPFLIRSAPRALPVKPNPVTSLTATKVDATRLRLDWRPAAATRGGVTEYRLVVDGEHVGSTLEGDVPAVKAASITAFAGSVTSHTLTVTPNRTYRFSVYAVNGAGFSVGNEEIEAGVGDPPSRPEITLRQGVGSRSSSPDATADEVSWTGATNAGGGAARTYLLVDGVARSDSSSANGAWDGRTEPDRGTVLDRSPVAFPRDLPCGATLVMLAYNDFGVTQSAPQQVPACGPPAPLTLTLSTGASGEREYAWSGGRNERERDSRVYLFVDGRPAGTSSWDGREPVDQPTVEPSGTHDAPAGSLLRVVAWGPGGRTDSNEVRVP